MRSDKETILYIDDEPFNLDGFEVSFRRHYNILTTTSVGEAFEMIEKNEVKVVISDQRMPEMSGLEFFSQLKQKNADIICIILTAYAEVSAIMQAINQGGIYRFMLKPWNENEMKITINNAIETYNLKSENIHLAGELKGTNLKLAESEARYEAIIQNTNDIIYSIDSSSTITFISDTIQIYGYSPDELIGKNISEIIHENDKNRVLTDFKAAFEFNQNFPTEFQLVDKAGNIFYVEERGKKSLAPNGAVQKGGVIRDISERKKIELALKHSKEKAEESDKLKSSFLANISHEIRTPLNAIMGFSGLLTSPDTDNERKEEYSSIINQSVDQLLTIITDIIDISIIESNQLTLANENFNIDSIFDEIYYVYNEQINRKGLELFINIALEEEEKMIYSDRDKLFQLLKKIIENSLKFTEDGFIEVGVKPLEEKPDMLHFFVKDTGLGIEPSKHSIIFNRFRKGDDNTSNISGGNGLGLTIAKAFAEALGGYIWLDSEVGKGTTFSFSVPLRKSKKSIQTTNTTVSSEYNWEGKKILIAEDEFANFFLLQEMLSPTNIKVHHAEDGIQALEACQKNDIDVVLMDLKMPNMNGFEATKEIKSIYHRLPIIAQTAYTASNDRINAYDAGCDFFIEKPIKKEKLMKIIDNIFSTQID